MDKEADTPLELHFKTDTYAVEHNIHFPTDLNLLWDSARKCLLFLSRLNSYLSFKIYTKSLFKKIKKAYRKAANIHRRKGNNYQERLQIATQGYLEQIDKLHQKLTQVLLQLTEQPINQQHPAYKALQGLQHYHPYLLLLKDQVQRRILKGEVIAHAEKIFSIFEPEVEWLSKNKAHTKVELGHKVLITTDQHHFIVDYQVVMQKGDQALVIDLAKRLAANYPKTHYKLKSISFDRGFYSQAGETSMSKVVESVIMPKPGKKSQARQDTEQQAPFVAARKAHSAVESNINELEHTGLNKVYDKGLDGFKRYVALGIVAYNLKRLGNLVSQMNLLPKLIKHPEANRAANPKKAA